MPPAADHKVESCPKTYSIHLIPNHHLHLHYNRNHIMTNAIVTIQGQCVKDVGGASEGAGKFAVVEGEGLEGEGS